MRRKAALLDTMTQYVRAVDGKNEAAVFELGKSVIRPAMAALGARTGKKIDYKIRGRPPFDVCQTADDYGSAESRQFRFKTDTSIPTGSPAG